jgi:hypothetical protein
MKLPQSLHHLFTNKYFLYVIVFLSATTNLGYLLTNNLNAIGFFILVGIIMVNFSKNMVIILTVCLVSTNLLMATKMREGMTGAEDSTSSDNVTGDNITGDNLTDEQKANAQANSQTASDNAQTISSNLTDEQKANAQKVAQAKQTKVQAKVQARQSLQANTGNEIINMPHQPADTLASDENEQESEDMDEATGFRPMQSKSKLDYGASIQNAYSQLNSILDPQAIKNLTSETVELMNQQKQLYSSMNSMAPLLNQAKSLLAGFDMKNINNLADMAKTIQ